MSILMLFKVVFLLVSIGLVLVLPVNYNVNEQNVAAAAFIPVSNFHLQATWYNHQNVINIFSLYPECM